MSIAILAALWLFGGLFGDGECRFAEEQAVRTMRQIGEQWPLRSIGDPVSEYVQRIGKRLVRVVDPGSREPWDFYVVRDAEPSAFAVGDGHFIVSDGLIALVRDESELAAVLAHEISHQTLGHFCRGASTFEERIDRGTVVQHYDLRTEMDADREAIHLLVASGYRPRAMGSVLNCLATLPSTNGADLAKRARALDRGAMPATGKQIAPSNGFATIQRLVRKDLGGPEHRSCR